MTDERSYFVARAEQERRMAGKSPSFEGRTVHNRLAELYEREAKAAPRDPVQARA